MLSLAKMVTIGQRHSRFIPIAIARVNQKTHQAVDTIQDGRHVRFLSSKQPPTENSHAKKPKFDFTVPPGQFIEVDGMNIHYEKLGTGSEVLFMMTPGMGSTRISFHYQLEGLDHDKFTLIAWDAPGFGFSRPPDREFPMDTANKDAHMGYKLLKKLGVEKANIFGFCTSAIPAMILAADRPEVAKKLVLIESFPYYTDQLMLYFEPLRQLKNWTPIERKRSVEVYGEEYLVKKINEMLDYAIRIRNINARNFCMEKLSSIRCPTLLLNSKQGKDASAMEQAIFMLNTIKDARMVMLETGSHFFLKEMPKLTNKFITDFILENKDENSDYK